MNDGTQKCVQCEVPMERGFIVDHGHSVVYPSAWVEGVPVWGWLLGVKTKGKTKLPIVAYRCPKCGRVDSFALPGEWRT